MFLTPGACAVYNYEFYENTQPTSYNCSKFTSGCPGELFHSKNIFKCRYLVGYKM